MKSTDEILAKLSEWRHLPSYSLEKRIDVVFGMSLPEIVGGSYEIPEDEIEVLPEFPIHKGLFEISSDPKDNQSVKVDFAAFHCAPKDNRLFLVELKTDNASINFAQLENLRRVLKTRSGRLTKRPAEMLFRGVIRAANASSSKRKYAQLIWKLHTLGCIDVPPEFRNMRMEHRTPGLTPNFRKTEVNDGWKDANIELVLITPNSPKEYELPRNSTVLFRHMSFCDVSLLLKKSSHYFSRSLAKELPSWASNPAGRANPWQQG